MGTPKAALEWHGSTLLRRVTGIIARAVAGPVVVVRAAGQVLPPLPAAIEVVDDERGQSGPLAGLAAGLGALDGRARLAYVTGVDAPFLHPAFVRRVVEMIGAGADADPEVALPRLRGVDQPLAAAYRTALAGRARELLAADHRRLRLLLGAGRVSRLDEEALLADPRVRAGDPCLESVLDLDDPAAYETARARPAPAITLAGPDGRRPSPARAATLAGAVAAAGARLDDELAVELNGARVGRDPELPLVQGDAIAWRREGPSGR